MHTEFGQFTLDLLQGRRPVLRHRDRAVTVNEQTLVVDVLTPGVALSFTRDFTQQLNVVYGQGKSINGSTFSGMKASADGSRITYEPFAYRRQVHPVDQNSWWDRTVMRKEVNLSFVEGVSETDARQIARSHLQRFADPGVTGKITLTADPTAGGHYLSWYLVKAGMSIVVRGLFGDPQGQLFHITECTVGPMGAELTVDSKYRDQLTVQEVRMRTRDSLAPVRLLTVGQFKPNIPDMLFPWSYSDGSGFLPKGSKDLFTGMDQGTTFPWTDQTMQRPPSDPKWAKAYAHIGPASRNADKNWANTRASISDFQSLPVRMSQAGEVALLQIGAYDIHGGSALPVPPAGVGGIHPRRTQSLHHHGAGGRDSAVDRRVRDVL